MTGDDVRVTFSRDEARALVRAAQQSPVTLDPAWTHDEMQAYRRAVRILAAVTNDTWGEADCGHQH